jgi:pimeloyl-ACP methyl ester carboxylesterase
MRRVTYSPGVLKLAFADPGKAPSEIVETLTSPKPAQLDSMLDIMMSGERLLSPAHVPTRILWGEADRLSVISMEGAQNLSASISSSSLEVIAGAGHLPQVECPELVIAEIVRFINQG